MPRLCDYCDARPANDRCDRCGARVCAACLTLTRDDVGLCGRCVTRDLQRAEATDDSRIDVAVEADQWRRQGVA